MTSCEAEVVIFQEGTHDLAKMMAENEYNFISILVPSDPESVEINGLIDGAHKVFNDKIASNEWGQRKVGWFIIDVEAYPAYSLDKEASSVQMVAINDDSGARKSLGL